MFVKVSLQRPLYVIEICCKNFHCPRGYTQLVSEDVSGGHCPECYLPIYAHRYSQLKIDEPFCSTRGPWTSGPRMDNYQSDRVVDFARICRPAADMFERGTRRIEIGNRRRLLRNTATAKVPVYPYLYGFDCVDDGRRNFYLLQSANSDLDRTYCDRHEGAYTGFEYNESSTFRYRRPVTHALLPRMQLVLDLVDPVEPGRVLERINA